MNSNRWQLLVTAPNAAAARAISALLQAHGLESQIESAFDAGASGVDQARAGGVRVRVLRLREAQKVLSEANLTDAELDFLATGQLSCDAAKERP